jgi:hypothetical protein
MLLMGVLLRHQLSMRGPRVVTGAVAVRGVRLLRELTDHSLGSLREGCVRQARLVAVACTRLLLVYLDWLVLILLELLTQLLLAVAPQLPPVPLDLRLRQRLRSLSQALTDGAVVTILDAVEHSRVVGLAMDALWRSWLDRFALGTRSHGGVLLMDGVP